MDEKRCNPHWLPTRGEIKKACEKIQASWSEAERSRRRGLTKEEVRVSGWRPPTVDLNDLDAAE